MSTYYALVCDECKKSVNFTRSSAGGDGWMYDAIEKAPSFVMLHFGCGYSQAGRSKIRVINEHEEEYGEYDDGESSQD